MEITLHTILMSTTITYVILLAESELNGELNDGIVINLIHMYNTLGLTPRVDRNLLGVVFLLPCRSSSSFFKTYGHQNFLFL